MSQRVDSAPARPERKASTGECHCAKGRTVVLGLEHFIDKIGYQAAEYGRRGIDALYLVLDKSGLSRQKAEEYGARMEVVPGALMARILFTMRALRRERPQFCELYDIGRLTLLYALLAKVSGAHLILILRGAELWQRERNGVRQAGLRLALRLSDHIVAKELNIVQDLQEIGVPTDKVTFIGNCVPFPVEEPPSIHSRGIDLLFLNSVKKWRNVDLIVRALPRVLREVPVGRVVIAGFTHLDATQYRIDERAEREVLALIAELELEQRIEVMGFVSDPQRYYADAKVFLLPADIVFANYSLLEAMSHGVAPVVGDGEGAELIVRTGENGLVVERTTDALASALIGLLGSAGDLARFSTAARRTIAEEFSIYAWGDSILGVRDAVCNH